jgi:hypothetical protein
MQSPGENKGTDNPLAPFVGAIIMWMWAGVIYLSEDREIPFFGKLITDTLKWAFGYVVAALFFVLLGGLLLWAGIWNWKKQRREKDNHEKH